MLNAIKKKTLFLNVFSILFLFNLVFANPTDGCELPENTVFLTDTGDVIYNVPTDFAGIQFDVDGATASSASGGEAGAAGWILNAAGSTVLGFSFSNTAITTDCGLLLTLELSGEATGLSGIVISDPNGQAADFSYWEEDNGGGDGSVSVSYTHLTLPTKA